MLPAVSGGISASPVHANPQPIHQWTPENEDQVKAYIQQAMDQNHGDVALAFAQLRDLRQQPAHYYDTNMAIAADYLRARWDTQRFGPQYEATEVTAYLAAKRTTGVPQEGPGPVSPYSNLEAKYMYKGIADQVGDQSLLKNLEQNLQPGNLIGGAYGVYELAKGPVESVASGALHGAEHAGGKVLKFFHL